MATCPTCRKTNCGNHASCARRKSAECQRCGRSPCYDTAKCEVFDLFWGMVAKVEESLDTYLKEEEIPKSILTPELLGKLRFRTYETLVELVREEEMKAHRRAIARFMFGQ